MEENWNYGGPEGENSLRAGAGLLLSLLFSSEFVLVVLGIALLVAGLCLARRR